MKDILYQGVGNHIINFPRQVGVSGDPQHWIEENANITLTFVDDLPSEAPAVPQGPHVEALKAVAITAGRKVYQRITFDDRDFLFPGDVVSAGVWVYQASTTGTITFYLQGDGSGTIGSVSTTKSGEWTRLTIPGVETSDSGTYLDFIVSHDEAATFYFTLPCLYKGKVALPFRINPMILKPYGRSTLTSAIPGTSWSTITASGYDQLAIGAFMRSVINSGTGVGVNYRSFLRPTWVSEETYRQSLEWHTNYTGHAQRSSFFVALDDEQKFQVKQSLTGSSGFWIFSGRQYLRWAY